MVAGRRQQGTPNQVANVDAGAEAVRPIRSLYSIRPGGSQQSGSIVYEMAFMMATCCVTRT
jgi:hypothetical protein